MDRMQFTADLVTLRSLHVGMKDAVSNEEIEPFPLNLSDMKVLLNMLNSFDSQTGALSTPIDEYVNAIYGKV